MPKFRKKLVEIEARQFDGNNADDLIDWINTSTVPGNNAVLLHGFIFMINTLEGPMRVDLFDYVIKGVAGEFYPCKPHIFSQTYELVE